MIEYAIGEPNVQLCNPGDWITEEKTDVQYRVWKEGRMVIIAIQGSVSLIDWLFNFRFFVKPYKRMKELFFVHSGWLKCYKSIRNDVLSRVKEFLEDGDIIYVAGFSKGAGEGLLCAEDMSFHFGEERVYGDLYGCPKAVWWLFAKRFAKRIPNVRVWWNGSDPVPRVPFWWTGYVHVIKPIRIGERFNYFKQFKPLNYHRVSLYKKEIADFWKRN